jgi:fluoroquinolone transport system permease protein
LTRLGPLFGRDLTSLYPLVIADALLLLAPAVIGLVVGFLLLDQRDDRTLLALQVTPIALPRYLAYRLVAPMLLSLPLTLAAFPLARLGDLVGWPLVVAALAATPIAPLTALALAAFAENKVQGFALLKLANVLLLAPLATIFVGPPWSWLLAISPTYWPAKLFWLLQRGDASGWLYLLGGLIYHGLLLALLLRRFERVLHQ